MIDFAFTAEQEDFRKELRPVRRNRSSRPGTGSGRYRDVASYLVADGTAAIQKRIIATSLLGKVATQ